MDLIAVSNIIDLCKNIECFLQNQQLQFLGRVNIAYKCNDVVLVYVKFGLVALMALMAMFFISYNFLDYISVSQSIVSIPAIRSIVVVQCKFCEVHVRFYVILILCKNFLISLSYQYLLKLFSKPMYLKRNHAGYVFIYLQCD